MSDCVIFLVSPFGKQVLKTSMLPIEGSLIVIKDNGNEVHRLLVTEVVSVYDTNDDNEMVLQEILVHAE